MKHEVKIGQTDYTVLILIRDSSTGAPKTALTFESPGIDVCYTRVETDNDVVLTAGAPVTTTLTGDHVDWGFVKVDDTNAPGLYELDIADGVFATGAWSAVVSLICTGCDPVHIEFVMVPEAPYSGVSPGPDSITAAKIADDAFSSEHFNTGAFTADAFAADAIVAATLATGCLTADAFAADALVAATFATDCITDDAIATGAIASTAFAAGAITNAAVADDVDVNTKTITAGAITATAIADAAIDFATFAADCKTGTGLKANVESISANAITATAINADAITSAKIADDAFSSEHFNTGAFTADAFAADALVAATFATDCITDDAIATGAIAASAFAAGAIDAAAIAAGAIDNATFAADVGSTAYATNIIALAAKKALDEYDPPTNAEMILRTLAAADYTVVTDLGVVQTGDSFAIVNGDHGLVSIQDDIDAILVDTGTTLDAKLELVARSVVYKWILTTASGNLAMYDAAGDLIGTVAGAFVEDATTKTRLKLVPA